MTRTIRKALAGAAVATALAVITGCAAAGGPAPSSSAGSAPQVVGTPAAAPCSAQLGQWSSGPGYAALKRINSLAWDPINISAVRLHSAIAAVQAHPLPVCAQGSNSKDWNDLIRQMQRAELNARAGNSGTAAGALGSAAGIMLSLSLDADNTGYMGTFPG